MYAPASKKLSHTVEWRESERVWLIDGVPGESDDMWTPVWETRLFCRGEEVDSGDHDFMECKDHKTTDEEFCPRCENYVDCKVKIHQYEDSDRTVHRKIILGASSSAYFCPVHQAISQEVQEPYTRYDRITKCELCGVMCNHFKCHISPEEYGQITGAKKEEQ